MEQVPRVLQTRPDVLVPLMIEFDPRRNPFHPFCDYQRGAVSSEWIEDNLPALCELPQKILNQTFGVTDIIIAELPGQTWLIFIFQVDVAFHLVRACLDIGL